MDNAGLESDGLSEEARVSGYLGFISLSYFLIAWILGEYYGSTFSQDFISNGLSTLLGVVIGIPIAVWIATYQERQTIKERRDRIILSLRAEIETNLEGLERDKWDEDHYEKGTLSARLRTETWKAFSDGGELKWIRDPNLLYILAAAYDAIRVVQYLSDKYYGLHIIQSRYAHKWQLDKINRDLTNKVGYARIALHSVYGYILGYISRYGIDVERSAFETLLKQARDAEVR